MNTDNYATFSRAQSVTKGKHGLEAALDNERLRIDVLAPDCVRIKISRAGVFDEKPSYALAEEPSPMTKGFKVNSNADSSTLETEALRVVVSHEPFAIDVYRADGSVVFESVRDANGSWSYGHENDSFVIRRKLAKNDPIYGLGEKTGSFNRRGRDFTMWNTDVLNPTASGEFTGLYQAGDPRADNTSTEFDPYYVSIPFFYHQDAASGDISGSFIDNPYRGFYDFTADDELKIQFDGGQYTEYVFAGPDMASILFDYTQLTGRTALPPLWSLGFHQCRWFGYNQDDVERMVAKYREVDVPLDAFWLDIDYMDGYRVFTWNKEKYPDAPGMLKRLAEAGVKVITIIDPGVKIDPGYEVYDDGVQKQVFAITEGGDEYVGQVWPGDTAFPDFANEDARAWWGELNAEHVKSGLAGIWNDMNEPATGDKDPQPMRFDHGKYEHDQFHNQYAMLMAMGTTEGLLKAMPNLRTFVLSRAGSPGIQRYAANWMGDNMSRWAHLWLSIPMGNGLSVSGQSFVGADIGGFAEDTNQELYARWIQYGALTPFARVHSVINTIDQYPWSFGEQVLNISREALKLRYRLLPYIYSSFVISSQTGAPIQAPLIYDAQYDPNVRDIDDQYAFGPNILVAPVFAAGQTKRDVYLPGGEWFDWHTGEHYVSEGQTFTVDAPLERIPMFVRAGAVIPMLEHAPQNTAGLSPKKLQLHVFVPESNIEYDSMLQEDDGLTFDAADGKLVRTELRLVRNGDRTLLEGRSTGKKFDGFARESFDIVWHTARGVTETNVSDRGNGFSIFGSESADGSTLVAVSITPKKKWFGKKA
jgi:alpha-glucosidase